MTIRGLDHVIIAVSDWDRSTAFYRDVLGAEVVERGNGRVCFRLGETQLNVHGPGFFPTSNVARLPVGPGNSDICFRWDGPITGAVAHLKRCGVEVETGPVDRPGAAGEETSVYFRDPDGSLLELISYSAGVDEQQPAGDLHVGTVVVNVKDMPRAVSFWSAALGYRTREKTWDAEFTLLEDPAGTWPPVSLQLADSPPGEPVRIHLDLYTATQAHHVERLVELGATRLTDWPYPDDADFVVLRDPDGNEFCVIDHPDLEGPHP